MKKYDFVFIYEGKNRELNSVCLLAAELEKRGYTCHIINTWYRVLHIRKQIEAQIVFTFALYNEDSLKFISQYVCNYKNIINLQWEQIFTNDDMDRSIANKNAAVGVCEAARDAIHISWGQYNYEMLTGLFDVSPNNVILTGNVAWDFYREEFDTYRAERKVMCWKFDIDEASKIVLYVSSFSYSGIPQTVINSDLYQNQNFNVNEFVNISVESQKKTVEWLCRAAERYSDYTFIYRPHPAESDNYALKEMARQYKNIKIIAEYPIGKWIMLADYIYVWWSTTLCDVKAAHKQCSILRPLDIPYGTDLRLYNNCKKIVTFEDFEADLSREKQEFPLSDSETKYFAYIDDNEPAYMRICNIAEKAFEAIDNGIWNAEIMSLTTREMVFKNLKSYLAHVLVKNKVGLQILRARHTGDDYDSIIADRLYTLKMYKNNYVSNHIIKKIIKRYKEKISN